jgi:putative membrane protein
MTVLSRPANSNPTDLVVRPSTKLLVPFYLLSLGLIIAILIWKKDDLIRAGWFLLLPGLILIWTLARHIGLRFTKVSVGGGKIRYETGMLAHSTRTMEIHKVQDVRVDQSLAQRLLGTGNISIETAGEASRLTLLNIDRPQHIADRILEAAHNPNTL